MHMCNEAALTFYYNESFIRRRPTGPPPWWGWRLMFLHYQQFGPPSEPACRPSRPSPVSSSRCAPCPPVSCHSGEDGEDDVFLYLGVTDNRRRVVTVSCFECTHAHAHTKVVPTGTKAVVVVANLEQISTQPIVYFAHIHQGALVALVQALIYGV